MGGKGLEYEGKVFIRWDGLHLAPPIWQKLSARRCVNFQVAYPVARIKVVPHRMPPTRGGRRFASRVQSHRHSKHTMQNSFFFRNRGQPLGTEPCVQKKITRRLISVFRSSVLTRVSTNVALVILPYAGPKVFCRFCAPLVGKVWAMGGPMFCLLAGMCQWVRVILRGISI